MILTLDDFEAAARKRLPRSLFGFAANGAERGASVAANAEAYEKWSFIPRSLVDVSSIDQQRSIFGVTYASPFGIAPMGGCALFAQRADLILARAARETQVPFILSAASSTPLEEIVAEVPQAWYQGYIPGDPRRIEKLLGRLAAARIQVLVVTVDVPVASNRDRDRRTGFAIPLKPRLSLAVDGLMHPRWLISTFAKTLLLDGIPQLPNFTGEPGGRPIISAPVAAARTDRNRFTWEHISLIRRLWKGALVIKGILAVDDARRAAQIGADGVIVSNHGGRQLDGAVAPLEVLPEILEVSGSMLVGMDGAIRRGTDVLKALALGARMVFVGRPMLYAASVAGQRGVEQAVQILKSELDTSLALLGLKSIGDLSPDCLRRNH